VYALVAVILLLAAPVAQPSRALGLILIAVLGGFGLAAIRKQTLDEFGDAPGPQLKAPWGSRGKGAQLDQLERLQTLHERGALTDIEYEQQKGAILAG
jgi:putative oligomerization/nucleic acid binding protein